MDIDTDADTDAGASSRGRRRRLTTPKRRRHLPYDLPLGLSQSDFYSLHSPPVSHSPPRFDLRPHPTRAQQPRPQLQPIDPDAALPSIEEEPSATPADGGARWTPRGRPEACRAGSRQSWAVAEGLGGVCAAVGAGWGGCWAAMARSCCWGVCWVARGVILFYFFCGCIFMFICMCYVL